jgi:peroxiredoxin
MSEWLNPKPKEEELMARQLNAGELFPECVVQTVDSQTIHIPQDFSGEYSVLIFYRGIW